jgi:hypothetical protein
MLENTVHLDALNDFDPAVRAEALQALIASGAEPEGRSDNVNMHVHTFFSYNAEGWSPSRVAWEAYRSGLFAVGIIDFDVLDGMEEFYQAGELLGLRTCVGVETRVFYAEYADKEIDSPGEPGVHYLDGIGFHTRFPAGSPQAETLATYRRQAQERNAALIARINPHLPDIALDYEVDVLPRSPGRCPTERHIIAAYVDAAAVRFQGDALITFWSDVLGVDHAASARLLIDRPALEEKVRAKLAKRGGVGYEQPTAQTFPPMDAFYAWVRSCDAIPMESWLDGTSEGESDSRSLLECSVAKGARALNIIPDRNWNIADPEARACKVAKLREIVTLADSMGLPINIGTEMNKQGQPLVDDLDGSVLREFAEIFRRGAMILTGHALCARFAGFSYAGDAAEAAYPQLAAKNAFFAAVGSLPPVDAALAARLRDAGPERALATIHDAVARGHWQ